MATAGKHVALPKPFQNGDVVGGILGGSVLNLFSVTLVVATVTHNDSARETLDSWPRKGAGPTDLEHSPH